MLCYSMEFRLKVFCAFGYVLQCTIFYLSENLNCSTPHDKVLVSLVGRVFSYSTPQHQSFFV